MVNHKLLSWESGLLVKWLAGLPCKHNVVGLIPTAAGRLHRYISP